MWFKTPSCNLRPCVIYCDLSHLSDYWIKVFVSMLAWLLKCVDGIFHWTVPVTLISIWDVWQNYCQGFSKWAEIEWLLTIRSSFLHFSFLTFFICFFNAFSFHSSTTIYLLVLRLLLPLFFCLFVSSSRCCQMNPYGTASQLFPWTWWNMSGTIAAGYISFFCRTLDLSVWYAVMPARFDNFKQ